MLIPEKLLEKIKENGICVTPVCDSKNNSVTAYLFTKKSPSGLEWKTTIGSGATKWSEFVWQTQMWFANFFVDNEAIKLYEAHTTKENGERFTLQELLDEMHKCYDDFVIVLTNIIETYTCSLEERYIEAVLGIKEKFENVVYDTTARSQDKEKDLVTAILNRKTFFVDCDGVSSLFTTYLVTEKVVDFLNSEKLTDKQKTFILAQKNPVKELVKVTKHSFDYFMNDGFFNDVIPEALNMLMNSQSEESEGDNNG